MATKKTPTKKTPVRKKKVTGRKQPAPASRGLSPAEAVEAKDDATALLEAKINSSGGALVGAYRDPLGGQPLVLALLPVDQIMPTPFQRDLSEAHVKRLEGVLDRVDVFLDPVIAVVSPYGSEAPFWTPNGHHRLSALRRLGAKTVTCLVSTDPALAYRILALNTEKAHSTKERSLEAVRMARGLAEIDGTRLESEFSLEFEEGALVTLGMAYESRPRFAGGAYAPALKASDGFIEKSLDEALAIRTQRAEKLLAIDDRVGEIIAELKERGFDSPYLRNFVVARIRPFRSRGKDAPDPDALLEHMATAAATFDLAKVKEGQIAKAAGSD